MEIVFNIFKWLHITAGAMALLSGLMAIIFRNRLKMHKPFGMVYFVSMTLIFFTALYMSLAHKNIFLFCVACFTYYSCLTAFRSLRLKNLHQGQKPLRMDWYIEVIFGTLHALFVVFAIYCLVSGHPEIGIISMVFGLIGLRGNQVTIARLRGRNVYRNYWLLAHIGGMLGSYIGAITAFTVNNSGHIPLHPLILWLGPTVLLVPLLSFEISRHKKLAGKFKEEVHAV